MTGWNGSPGAGPAADAITRRDLLRGAAATGVSAGLAGCTLGQAGDASGTVVQLAADSGTYSARAEINRALHDAGLPADVRVEVIVVGSDTAQSQFSQWLSAGLDRPDLLRMDSGWTVPFVLRDQIANLSEELPETAKTVESEYFQASVDTLTAPNGDVYGVPMFSDFGLLLYRKDLVRQAGFDPSGWATSPRSWKQFAEVAKRTMDQTDTTYGFTFQADIYEGLSCCDFTEFMTTWGGSYFGARKNLLGNVGERPVTVDTDPVVDATRMVRSFIHGPDATDTLEGYAGPIAPDAVLAWQEDSSLAAFLNGEAVMHRNWPYSVLEAGAPAAFGEDLGVMPIPYGVEVANARFQGMGGTNAALGGWHVTLNPNATNKQAAKAVLRAMTADGYYLRQMEVLGFVPPKPALLDSRRARNVDAIGRYVDQLKFAGQHAIPRPVTVVWPLQSPRISQQVSAAFSGDKSPTSAMSDLQRILTEIENSAREGE